MKNEQLKTQIREHFFLCIKKNKPNVLIRDLMLILFIVTVIFLTISFLLQKKILGENMDSWLISGLHILAFALLTGFGSILIFYFIKIDKFIRQIEHWSFYDGPLKFWWGLISIFIYIPLFVGAAGLIFLSLSKFLL